MFPRSSVHARFKAISTARTRKLPTEIAYRKPDFRNTICLRRRFEIVRHFHASFRAREQSRSPFIQMFQAEFRRRPVALSITVFGVFLVTGVGLPWAFYQWWKAYQDYQGFPGDVAVKLRRALHWSADETFDAAQAFKAYISALRLAEQEGMDPLSDEVILIQWKLCSLCEKTGNIQEAIDIVGNMKQNCLKWIEQNQQTDENAGRRARLLSRACDASTRMGELYTHELIGDAKNSEDCLVWAVETAMKERQRRQRDGLKPGEQDWFSEEQHETQLEALGHFYEEQNRHFYAAQLFLKALTIKPKQDCHSVILMNNVAASVSQQAPPVEPGTQSATPQQLRENGRRWARQALDLGRAIQPPERTEECDRGCAVATHNLGEFAEMEGDFEEAREKYEEAASLAHAIGFEEGVRAADEGLKRLMGNRSQKKHRSSWW